MLFLHGAGERGDDLRLLLQYGPPRIANEDPDFPFVLIAPQCPLCRHWELRPLFDLLDHALANFRIDPERVVVTGVSMGGYGTWNLGMAAPDRFAAIAPVCGGGDINLAHRLRKVPIWAFHGEEDDIVSPIETIEMVEAVRSAGGYPRMTLYPKTGHDAWAQAYATPELYGWLLAQKASQLGSLLCSPQDPP